VERADLIIARVFNSGKPIEGQIKVFGGAGV
jgi:hypothetical protein